MCGQNLNVKIPQRNHKYYAVKTHDDFLEERFNYKN